MQRPESRKEVLRLVWNMAKVSHESTEGRELALDGTKFDKTVGCMSAPPSLFFSSGDVTMRVCLG